jgi:hypothetical protein
MYGLRIGIRAKLRIEILGKIFLSISHLNEMACKIWLWFPTGGTD